MVALSDEYGFNSVKVKIKILWSTKVSWVYKEYAEISKWNVTPSTGICTCTLDLNKIKYSKLVFLTKALKKWTDWIDAKKNRLKELFVLRAP